MIQIIPLKLIDPEIIKEFNITDIKDNDYLYIKTDDEIPKRLLKVL